VKIIWKIKEIRDKKGISQLKLSSISGVCKSNIGAIEIGVIKKPSFIDILRISKALEVDINELYEEIN
jgi:DNA-binding helix-turn-helix protein